MAILVQSSNFSPPIILIGTHRSGTTWLAKIFSYHPSLALWMEPKYVWSWGNNYKPNDILSTEDATPKVIAHIQQRFEQFIKQQGKERLCEKTPSNCLRLPFIHAVYPTAKIIHVIRDGRSVFHSAGEIRSQGYYRPEILKNRFLEMLTETPILGWPAYIPRITETLTCKLSNRPLNFWGPRPFEWQEWLKTDTQNIIMAKQWVATVTKAVTDGMMIGSQSYYKFHYEDFIARPQEIMCDLMDFAELSSSEDMIQYVINTVDSSRQRKWRKILEEKTLAEIRPYMEPTLRKLGYEW